MLDLAALKNIRPFVATLLHSHSFAGLQPLGSFDLALRSLAMLVAPPADLG